MQVAVTDLVPQILAKPVAPMGVHSEPRVGFQKERAAGWHVWIVVLQEFLVALGVGKQIYVDWLVAAGQAGRAIDVVAFGDELTHKPVIGREFEVAVKD